MTRSFSRMLSAENSSKLSAQSPACSRKALPAATWPSVGLQRAGLAGEHQRRIRGDLLQRPIEVARDRASRAAARQGTPATTIGDHAFATRQA